LRGGAIGQPIRDLLHRGRGDLPTRPTQIGRIVVGGKLLQAAAPAALDGFSRNVDAKLVAAQEACLHRLGHRDVALEAKRFRHRAITIHQVAVCDVVASSAGQQSAQRQQRDVA
jgi:hypothetical protein